MNFDLFGLVLNHYTRCLSGLKKEQLKQVDKDGLKRQVRVNSA